MWIVETKEPHLEHRRCSAILSVFFFFAPKRWKSSKERMSQGIPSSTNLLPTELTRALHLVP